MSRGTYTLLALAAAALPSAAAAQDVNWSGFYVGAELGGVRSDMDAVSSDLIQQLTNINPAGPQPITVVPGTTRVLDQSQSETNLIYGGLVGFQGQSGNLVFGVEAGLDGPRDAGQVNQDNAIPPTILSPASTVTQERDADMRYSWSVRGRVGVGMGRTLLYAAGGVTGARVELEAVNTYTIPAGNGGGVPPVAGPAIGPNVTTASERRSMTGWTAGLGGEQMLSSHVSLGLDLRYDDYGSKTFTFDNIAITRSGATTFPGAAPGADQIGPPNNDVRANPGPTRISLNEWRLAVRLVFRF